MKAPLLALWCLSVSPFVYGVKFVPVPVPNGDCSDASLRGFRFRYDQEPAKQDQYVENHKWVSAGVVSGRKAILIQAPARVLGNQTAKIESPYVPIEPGATYKYQVDYYLDDTGTKMWAETFVVDPRPDAVREREEAKGKNISLYRFKPANGLPALIMIHRSAAPDLGKEEKRVWTSMEKEATIPLEWPLTLPFTVQGDGVQTTFPVKSERKDEIAKFEIVEVRMRTAGQKLPYRQNLKQDYNINGDSIVFVKPPPPDSEVTVSVRWKLRPRLMSIKAIALGGKDNSTAAFTNFRITKTKEPGEAPPPVDEIR